MEHDGGNPGGSDDDPGTTLHLQDVTRVACSA